MLCCSYGVAVLHLSWRRYHLNDLGEDKASAGSVEGQAREGARILALEQPDPEDALEHPRQLPGKHQQRMARGAGRDHLLEVDAVLQVQA